MKARHRVAGLLSPPMPRLRSAPAFGQSKPTTREVPSLVARALLRHRRVVAAGCLALAIAIGLTNLAPSKTATVNVVAAARDLSGGTVLKPDDVRWVALPVIDEPTGALTAMSSVVGQAVAGPIRSGEAITDVRLVGGAAAREATDTPLAPPGDGLVATPVRLADIQAAELLRVGEHVDVLAATPSGGGASAVAATVVADDVRVVAIPATPADGNAALDSATGDGALVVLATTTDQAKALAQAELSARLSAVVIR